jgi:hypothetical protein
MDDMRQQVGEWAEITACLAVFQAQLLIARKIRYNT